MSTARPPSLPIPPRRLVFYVLFGVILPVVCVLADPMVFVGSGFDGRPMLRNFRVFGYLQIAVGVTSMTFFLWRQRPSAILSGILLECALFSAAIGVVLFLPSLIGLFAMIGILGFTPILSACAFGEAARRASPASDHAAGPKRFLGVLLALAIPLVPHVVLRTYTDHLVGQVVGARATSADLRRLARLHTFADLDPVLEAYGKSSPDRQAYYDQAYRDLTGHTIEEDFRWFLHGD